MKQLTVEITESDYKNFNFQSNEPISFIALQNKIKKDLIFETLKKCRSIAKETGLSEITTKEINEEIKNMRLEKYSKRNENYS